MKKILIILMALVEMACNSVSTDIIEPVHPSQKENSVHITSSSLLNPEGDSAYHQLGYGYDCKISAFKGEREKKGRIIDLEKYLSGKGYDYSRGEETTVPHTLIEVGILHSGGEVHEVFGRSIGEYCSGLYPYENVENRINRDTLSLFTGNVEEYFRENGEDSDNRALLTIDTYSFTRKITMSSTDPATLRLFLTDDFVHDCKKLSGSEIIEKYGTHVLTDLLLGGILSFVFDAREVSDPGRYKSEALSFQNAVIFRSSTKGVYKGYHTFSDIRICIESIGGDISVAEKDTS